MITLNASYFHLIINNLLWSFVICLQELWIDFRLTEETGRWRMKAEGKTDVQDEIVN